MDTEKSWAQVRVESSDNGPADVSLLARAAHVFGWELQLSPSVGPDQVSAVVGLTEGSLHENVSELVVLLALAENLEPREILSRISEEVRTMNLNLKQSPRRFLGGR